MKVRDVMTPEPLCCSPGTSLFEAARIMRDHDIGDVLVVEPADALIGIVTDRDLVVRGLAGEDVAALTLGDLCSSNVRTVEADATVDDVVRLMSEQALRRIPVVEGQRPIGIVSLGDLAVERDPGSVLGQISVAPPD